MRFVLASHNKGKQMCIRDSHRGAADLCGAQQRVSAPAGTGTDQHRPAAGEFTGNRFSLDGGVEIVPSELFDGAEKMDCYVSPEDYKVLTENSFVLGEAPVPLFYGAACQDVNTIGGFANWVQEDVYKRQASSSGKAVLRRSTETNGNEAVSD